MTLNEPADLDDGPNSVDNEEEDNKRKL